MERSVVQGVETGWGLRNRRLGGAIVALIAACTILAGCNPDEAVRAFRSGSSDQLQAGLESIALGVINGLFTAIDTGTGDSGSADSSGATTTAGATATDDAAAADAAATDAAATP